MAITNAFRQAVSSGNIKGIRIMMKDSLLVDPTFSEFEQMERLAVSVRGLYDAHDGRGFETDRANWDDDYMDRLMVQAVGNFSRERIAHLQEVVRFLHPAPVRPARQSEPDGTSGVKRSQRGRSSRSYREQRDEDMRSGRIVRVDEGIVRTIFGKCENKI